MNWQHFRAFLWLRWRLGANQLRRGGVANAVIVIILIAFAVLLAVGLFTGAFLTGLFLLAKATPTTLVIVWDGMVLGFLFFWCIGLISDLQRAEALSLNKFLHLPVSLSGAFLINYLSSLFHAVMILLGPALLGLALGLACSRGPAWLLLLPPLAAFLLAVTALTYQFQGWLATLMANPRRRRTVIVVATMVLVVLSQLPNLMNILRPWKQQGGNELATRLSAELAELQRRKDTAELSPEEFRKEQERVLNEHKARNAEAGRQTLQQVGEIAGFLNLVLPPGWVALGAEGLAAGNAVPALLGTLGLGLIGAGSLWRAYRTTVRFYTGQVTPRKRKPAAAAPAPSGPAPPARFLEKRLPGLSEPAAAITLGGFRSLTRAPEAKMMLLTPVLMAVLFGGMLASQPVTMPGPLRPLLPFGAMAMVLLGMLQVMGNQFGFDRAGFRVFVLCGAPRRDVLLGKNLAAAPFALGMGTLLAVLIQVLAPLRVDHFLAFFPQAVAMYLVFCLLVNSMSILAPLPVAAGAFRPTNFKGLPLLLNLAFLPVFPAVMAPLLLPLAAEWVLGGSGLPIYLVLTLAECAAVVALYLLALKGQGRWLQSREQKILQVVAAKAE